MRVRTPEAERLSGILRNAGYVPRPVAHDTMLVDGATPEALGPLIASNAVVVYELIQVSQDLESLFLELTTSMTDRAARPEEVVPR